MKNNFKKFITSILMLGTIFPSFVSPLEVMAQPSDPQDGQTEQDGDYSDYGDYLLNVTEDGILGYVSGLAPAIAELPLCKAKLHNSLRNLFSGQEPSQATDSSGNPVSGNPASIYYSPELADPTAYGKFSDFSNSPGIGDEALSAINQSNAIPTFSESEYKKLQEIHKTTTNTDENVESIEQNDTCLKSIGRLVIRTLLQKITMSTIKWIQNGFEGGPAFLSNTGEFFTDLARTEVLQFGLEINNPVLFPFGKNFIQKQALAFNREFQESARYRLDELIADQTPQYSASAFQGDFSQGGWNAWLGMTQYPQNNPVGFDLLAGEELARRITDGQEGAEDALQQADGYLGDLRCAEPKGITMAQHNAALVAGVKAPITSTSGAYQIGGNYQPSGQYILGTCRRWEYVTPGKIISEAATTAINYQSNALLDAEDLNDAVAAIIDALLTQFSTQLINKGFAYLPEQGSDGSFIVETSQFGDNFLPTQTQDDYGTYFNSSNWLRKHHDFNIRTDLTQAFIDTQRTYVEKLRDYNEILKSLIRVIYQLDFCIPGPRPDYKEIAYSDLNNVARSIPGTPGGTVAIIKGLFQMLKGINVGVSFIVTIDINVGYLSEGILSMLGEGLPEEVMTRYFYTTILINHTGLRVAPSAQIGSKGDVIGIMNEIINGYDEAVKKTFHRGVMPEVTSLAAAEYRKAKGYKQLIENNLDEIARINSAVATLYRLKEAIGELPGANADGTLPPDYDFGPESELLGTFARLTTTFVDGDDIADVQKLIGQARDSSDYVFKDLLAGEGGCECNLDPQLEEETDRMPYPRSVFIPLQGRDYIANGGESGVTCTAGDNTDPNTCIPPLVLGNNGECVNPAAGEEICQPGPVGICDDSPDTPAPPCEPPQQNECWIANDEANPFDANEDDIHTECEPEIINGEVVELVSINGVCVPIPEPTQDLGDLAATIPEEVEVGANEGDFSRSVNKIVRDFKNSIGCSNESIKDFADNSHDKFKEQEKDFRDENDGFLSYGYYGQLESNNPYQYILRVPPDEALPQQEVKLPYGILNISQQCPVLVFGPHAERGAARSLRAQLRACRKEYNGDEQDQCYEAAWLDAVKMVERSCVADITIQAICKELKVKPGLEEPPYSPTDSVRRFEKVMKLY